jgi:hypothetical protein
MIFYLFYLFYLTPINPAVLYSARTGARALLRTDRWKLYDVQDGDVMHTPPYNFNSVRVRTPPPWRDVHRGVVARFFYHFQSRFLWYKKVFWRLLVPIPQTIGTLFLGSLVCCDETNEAFVTIIDTRVAYSPPTA